MITNYKSIIFDCDGVILNSNQVKKKAYFKVATSHFGDYFAKLLIEHLEKNNGKPREYFFEHLIKNIIPSNANSPSVQELVLEVGNEIHNGLLECEVSKDLLKLRNKTESLKWMIVSGGVESEIKEVFFKRSLIDLFDSGIFGGPKTKDTILKSLINNNLEFPALFIGDSEYDFQVAKRFKLDFLFASDWTNFSNWKGYCESNNIRVIKSLSDLI